MVKSIGLWLVTAVNFAPFSKLAANYGIVGKVDKTLAISHNFIERFSLLVSLAASGRRAVHVRRARQRQAGPGHGPADRPPRPPAGEGRQREGDPGGLWRRSHRSPHR